MSMSNEANDRLVVLKRWNFLFLLFVGMSFASLFSVVVMAKFLLMQEASLFPIVVSATFWAIVFSLLAGIIVVAAVAGAGLIHGSFFVGKTECEHKESEV